MYPRGAQTQSLFMLRLVEIKEKRDMVFHGRETNFFSRKPHAGTMLELLRPRVSSKGLFSLRSLCARSINNNRFRGLRGCSVRVMLVNRARD